MQQLPGDKLNFIFDRRSESQQSEAAALNNGGRNAKMPSWIQVRWSNIFVIEELALFVNVEQYF